MKNTTIKKWIGIGGALLVVLGIYYFFFSGSSTSEVTLQTLQPKKGEVVKTVTATGTIEPVDQVDVGTQVSGVIKKLYVDYNSVVKKGQLIAELDKTILKSTVLSNQASYDEAVNDRNYLKTIYDRQKKLYENKVISESDYQEASYNYEVAKNSVTENYASLQSAKTNLGYADIYSPIDGVVLSRDVDEGETVAASYSTPTFYTIAEDLRHMQVEADVDEADIGQVKEGQRVSFTVDAYQNEEFVGEVTQIRLDPTTTSNVVTYTVVVKAENPDLKLKPGLTATIAIYTVELKDVITVEAKAVNFTPTQQLMDAYLKQQGGESKPPQAGSEMAKPSEDSTILWVEENGMIKPQPVELGVSDGVNVQVLSGLSENDKVVYQMRYATNQSSPSGSGDSPFMPTKPPGGGGPR
ncbi:efflux RND transporter periplasmic adaptor subunit [Cellulophaga baltica]|uniref:efflux RND transporter periplasmic adaptor subunit n=1 Tax=Cellulophaga TaxID=104264 RepID=UPI001C07DA44|nr:MULTISPECIES: efflux RND transporter periplasmic adaptor subunit [Cellulophaga]MBU2996284.1 efflux RND transporter periplasmic adaptor subunit [Cellulophaga baltica]MDO6767679.1 efflux RND transporter periplasmic adaptor subunit [Cellulophaga sp. 1_MG-2023]